jgi:hypothetical protein
MGGAGGSGIGSLHLTGTASGEDPPNDLRVECTFDGVIDDIVETPTGWSGFAVGEVFRTLFPGEQVQEFSAFVAGEATLDYTGALMVSRTELTCARRARSG